MKKIFGSPKNESDSIGCKQLDAAGPSKVTETKTGCLPEWALALEPVRKLPTNVGARIRRCIHEALDKDPPEWARKVLEHSISKEVYKGNASGPTKRAVISVLTDLGQKIVPDKPEKKEKEECVVTNVTDLVMKQCRIVLRRVAAADEDRIFCNLLGRTLLKANDNDDEGLLGYPAMVSRPLDFRSIDLRLTAGSYCGSHEAFYDDVQEVWHNIHTAFKEQPDSIKLAEKLSKVFEELYDKEVLAIVQKTAEYGTLKEKDNLLSRVSESLIPKAPWEEGICKVCGMDKDDDNVLLCDGCDSEYHRYCLNPPLVKIPEGNWYCPSCVSGESTSQSTLGCFWAYNQYKLKKGRGEYRRRYMETLGQLANAMMIKEYWELNREERLFLLKFLCDEVLNSAVLRDHIDQCASLSADLQQKLRSLTSELKIQRLREEISGVIAVKDNLPIENGESRVDVLVSDNKNNGRLSAENGDANQTNGANIVQDFCLGGEGLGLENKHPVDCQQQETELGEDFNSNAPVSSDTENQRMEVEISMPVDPTVKFDESKRLDQPDLDLVKGPVAESGTPKNEISVLQDAIATVESELLKISVRKEFLGRDSHGRIYWAYSRPGCSPSIIANSPSRNVPSIPVAVDSSAASTEFSVQKWYSSDKTGYLPNFAMWMSFNSDSDIEELVEWLQDCDEREKELKESILNWRRSTSKIYTNDIVCKKEANSSITSNDVMDSAPEFPFTKALASLKKKIASCPEPIPFDTQKYQVLRVNESRICRCECLEPLYSSRHHCPVCHQTFITDEEHIHHTDETCKEWTPIPKSSYHEQTTPFNLEEIMTKFIVPNSLKELVNQVGFIAPDVANCGSTCVPNLADQTSSTIIQSSTDNEIHNSPSAERNKLKSLAERNQSSYVKDKGPGLGVNKSSIIHEFAQRPLVGRVSEVLRSLKISLLDMDAALPEEALRTSRSYPDRRRAWRSFTKYAGTIYEMIQATVTLEDTIKSEFLRNDWWYWASPSAAAKITTLSALALRIFALDSAILYDKSETISDTEKPQKPVLEREALESSTTMDNLKPDSPSMQRTPDPPDIPETTRLTRSRASKRRRDSVG
ncbi:hypothetical protein Leryth_009927 [Lithospermum erythrorhizon]|nr:hypothetical protein Leryth_009927 [Lithospermum erythrorhizon]